MRYFTLIVLFSLAIAAKANLTEPLKSYKNSYISCVNVVVAQILDATKEITEPLLLASCPNELAALKAVIPESLEQAFLQQLKEEVKANVQEKLNTASE